jgi:hypothetical protein
MQYWAVVIPFLVLVSQALLIAVNAFTLPTPQQQYATSHSPIVLSRKTMSSLALSSATTSPEEEEVDEAALQWDLLQKYHAKGSWKGIWSTYDYMGDLQDETVASVDLLPNKDNVEHTHTIVVGAKRSDCTTCFDSMETKTLPVATYTPATFQSTSSSSSNSRRPIRLASRSWVNGPTVLRSGAVATEIILAYNDGRTRVVFQHAPVWPKDVDTDASSGALPPPQGLKLFRVTVSREALREQAPTAETEEVFFQKDTDNDASSPQSDIENVVFYRPVPPFNWHKVWSGTSWTWGPTSGNRGWAIDAIEDGDDWHGSSPVEAWNMRLPGGVFIQSPRMITPDATGLLRLAWMPNDQVLLRVEAGVLALQPMELTDEEDLEESTVFAFEPPSLASLRCDVLRKTGDLEGEPQFVKDQRAKAEAAAAAVPSPTTTTTPPEPAEASDEQAESKLSSTTEKKTSNVSAKQSTDEIQSIDDVLQL